MPTSDQARASALILGAQRRAARALRLAQLRAILDADGDVSLLALRAALRISPQRLRADLRAIGEPPRKSGPKPAAAAAAKLS